MKRLIIACGAAILLGLPLVAAAQTATPIPFDPLTPVPRSTPAAASAQTAILVGQSAAEEAALSAERADLAAERAEIAADQAQFALDAADAAVARADSMLNQFQTLEAVVGIIGFMLPVLLVIGGLIGLNRLNSAQRDVQVLHDEFSKAIARSSASASTEIEAARQEARTEIEAAKAQLDGEMTRRQQELDALKESAQTVRQEAARARLASALLPLGEQQYKAGDLDGAIATYERALALDDRNPVTHYRLGYVYNQIGQLERALDELAAALDIDKDFLQAKAAIGYTYRRMAEALPTDDSQRELLYSEAELRLRDALTRQPRLVDDDGESWWGSLGGLYKRRAQFELAKDAYRRAGSVTPYSSYPFMNLAVLEMNDGQRDAMMAAFQRVERVARAETQAQAGNHYGLADLLTAQLALGKTAEADDTMFALFEMAPLNENALELELDTLERMLKALGGESEAPHVAAAMARIRDEIARRAGLKAG